MSIIKIKYMLSVAAIFLSAGLVFSQTGAYNSYSPYSVFGIGNIAKEGTAYNKTMGGVGIAGRDNRYINYINPAAITARDTLSFMVDMGLSSSNKVFRQNNMKSANNVFNISNIVVSLPLYKKSAMVFGISPYSDVGYNFSYYNINPDYGFHTYNSSGDGSIYQLFGGAAVTLWKNFSLGAQAIYYFGNIDKTTKMDFSSPGFRNISGGYVMQLEAVAGKFGVQYSIPISDTYFTIGATYRTGSKIRGFVREFKYASLSSKTDTLSHKVDTLSKVGNVRFAGEYGIGFSLHKKEKWNFEINYTFSDWRRSGFDLQPGFANIGDSKFSTTFSQSVKAGFEYIPNRNDIRYYMRRCAYRIGAYYDRDYYKLDGNTINSYGLTFGVTLPVFRLYNGLTLGVELGQKGNLNKNMVMEQYIGFSIGFSIHDIWFIKQRYE